MMYKLLALVPFLHLITLSSSLQLERRAPNIVNGNEVQPKFKYPFLVSIQLNGLSYCGGTLYKDNVVLTAAHCATHDVSKYSVLAHRHDLSKRNEDEDGKEYGVKEIIKHPNYSAGYRNDIAIFKLDMNSDGSNSKQLINLDTYNLSGYSGLMLMVAGWGATISGGYNSNLLMQVNVPVFKSDQCTNNYRRIGESVDANIQFCAGYTQGRRDACQGDSGGPLFLNFKNNFYLVGIVSWGVGCADPNLPGVYTKVYKYVNWINENI